MLKFRIKRLDLFILQSFLPQFLMTFFICLFIVMMQFLWKYIDELVGKGLSVDVLGELFFYAALTMVPMALPLAILLASLMTFGNLGEHVELTALKSSGVSLVQVMRPLIVLITAIAIGAFFFQNNVLPKAQVKMWTLLFSMKQKSPTLDIPEGAIYSQIQGYNLYVKHKNKENEMLYGILIYDVTNPSASYPRVLAADSGKLSMTADKRHLVLDIYNGDLYETLGGGGGSRMMGNDLYRREAFDEKKILIPYDATFTRMDDNAMRNQYVGKNISELQHTIDSVRVRVDSMGNDLSLTLRTREVCGLPSSRVIHDKSRIKVVPVQPVKINRPLSIDSLLAAAPLAMQQSVLRQAVIKASNDQQDCVFQSYALADDNFTIRRHQIELQKKFTLSLACLIFFFIGAPLGAIIRKGGLGTPIVVSVLLFIVYYFIDNMGYKLAKEGRWKVWEGVWLSSAVLLPLGIFLTYKAVNDSAVFNPDAYRNVLRRWLGLHLTRKLEVREVVMEDVQASVAQSKVQAVADAASQFLGKYAKRMSYTAYWLRGGFDQRDVENLRTQVEDTVDYLNNSRDQMAVSKLMDYPVVRDLPLYHLAKNRKVGLSCAIVFPIGLPIYVAALCYQRIFKRDVRTIIKVSGELQALLNA